MTSADIKPPNFASTLTTHPHLGSPPLPKRSRLSLRRSAHKQPCYKEDDSAAESGSAPKPESSEVEMIDLTQDENSSPNCVEKPKNVVTGFLGEDVKVWTLGLPNCGNTCYVNSILQVLRYTPDFLNSLHSLMLSHYQLEKVSTSDEDTKEIIFFKHMHLLYTAMKRKEGLMRVNVDKDYCAFLLKPVKLVIDSLRDVSVLFEEGEQHDAHELLITAITAFSTAGQSLKKRLQSSSTNEEQSSPTTTDADGKTPSTSITEQDSKKLAEQDNKKQNSTSKKLKKSPSFDESVLDTLNLGFEGRIRHIVQCLECEKRMERDESFINLEVNIPEPDCDPEEKFEQESVELSECLSQATFLSGENKFFCEECIHYNEARIYSEVINLPPILLLHFSWLRKTQEVSDIEKTNIKVMIPRLYETSNNADVFCCSPGETYKLFAVVLHIGQSTEGGHYVAFIKDAYQNIVMEDSDRKLLKPKFRSSNFMNDIEQCCLTEEITNFKTINSTTKWLLFDDNAVSPVCIEEDSKIFPYYNYLSITASPCMIFYHKV